MDKLKKIIIRMASRFSVDNGASIFKLENGYVFGDRYYPDIDSMKEDIVSAIKKSFES